MRLRSVVNVNNLTVSDSNWIVNIIGCIVTKFCPRSLVMASFIFNVSLPWWFFGACILLGLKVFDALLNSFEDFNFVAYVIVHYYNLLVAVILFKLCFFYVARLADNNVLVPAILLFIVNIILEFTFIIVRSGCYLFVLLVSHNLLVQLESPSNNAYSEWCHISDWAFNLRFVLIFHQFVSGVDILTWWGWILLILWRYALCFYVIRNKFWKVLFAMLWRMNMKYWWWLDIHFILIMARFSGLPFIFNKSIEIALLWSFC
jgi:hypothetical protein